MKGEGCEKREGGVGVTTIRSLERGMGQLSPSSPEEMVLIAVAEQIPVVSSYPAYGPLSYQLYKVNTALNDTKALHDLAGENSATEASSSSFFASGFSLPCCVRFQAL